MAPRLARALLLLSAVAGASAAPASPSPGRPGCGDASGAGSHECRAGRDALALDAGASGQDVSLLQFKAASEAAEANEASEAGLAPEGGSSPAKPDRELRDFLHVEPTPLRKEDWDYLAFLSTAEGVAILQQARENRTQVPSDWGGPRPPPPQLWGGPSRRFAESDFQPEVFPTTQAQDKMNYAGPGSGTPDGLWGIWWMDQFGFSSVAKDPSYPFAMIGSPEVLASFGPTIGATGQGARFERDTRCVTPIECYGGPQWAFMANENGDTIRGDHGRARNTLSFCYSEDMSQINIYQKMYTEHASIGPVTLGPLLAHMLGFQYAGSGYSWVPGHVMNMTMVKMPWGWDRVTTLFDVFPSLTPLQEWFLNMILPSWAWALIKQAQGLQHRLVSHYPVLQIIDGSGAKTKYYAEFMEFMKTVPNGTNLQMAMPS